MHAAATRDDVATALSEQASFERDKALRKSAPALFGSDARGARSGDDDSLEFADPEDENDDDDAVISADPVVDDDDDGIEVGGSAGRHPANDDDARRRLDRDVREGARVLAAGRRADRAPAGLAADRIPVRRDVRRRLPSPTPGFAGLSLSSPAPAPAPASSPFARLAPAPAGSPYGARATASALPALQIPAPSGAAAAPSGGSGLSRRVEVPVWVLWALFLAFPVALVLGWSLHTPPPAPPVVAARPSLPPVDRAGGSAGASAAPRRHRRQSRRRPRARRHPPR